MAHEPRRGRSHPLGATVHEDGVNFSIFSQHAEAMELLLFESADAPQPAQTIPFDPEVHKTFYYWHMFVPGLTSGQIYAFRAHGPMDPARGHRYDGSKVLVDPYSRAIVSTLYDRGAACRPGDNVAHSMRSVVVDTARYDWEGDTPLPRNHERSMIYEMHLAGFTRHPSSGVAPELRGTYRGLIEKIPYLKELGIDTVELLPVAQFDPQDAPAGLTNYWGYSPVVFMAPHNGYSSRTDPLGPVDEFRDMVKALHRAGIGVYLDVVFNHTTENGADGPTLSYRGLENIAYYIPGGEDLSTYANYSGTGNTVNSNHSIVRRLILDSLTYWVNEMHVDGFRFDLAAALSRGEFGEPLASPPILWSIESHPVLAGTAIIAEAWDAGGLYQVGSFIGDRFAEWNGRYRDDIRSFLKGDAGYALPASLRIVGSPDLYPRLDRNIRRTVNFITAHDGYTLNDLVSYEEKHNEANGEDNKDGHNDNRSWNGGVEGPTDDPAINAIRLRQVKNFFTLLLMSQGTPMLLMGDEVRRTQQGNNNAYGQDNEISWFDWEDLERHGETLRFVRALLALHNSLDVLHATQHLPLGVRTQEPFVVFHSMEVGKPDWDPETRWLSYTMGDPIAGEQVHVLCNAYWEAIEFALPSPSANQQWRRVIDTALAPPEDIHAAEQAPAVTVESYRVEPRSCVVLLAWPKQPKARGRTPRHTVIK